MTFAIRFKLSFMMFLEFFIWGAWFVTLGTFVKNNLAGTDGDVGVAFLSQSIGAIIAPFVIGMIADKYFAAQRIFGVLHLIGAIVLYVASNSQTFAEFTPYVMVYMVCFMPTLALANSVSFRQLTNTEKEFPGIRVFGSIGWIVAGLLIGWLSWEQQDTLDLTFKLAAAASAVLAIFSLFLPNTPPSKKNEKTSVADILGLEAFQTVKKQILLIVLHFIDFHLYSIDVLLQFYECISERNWRGICSRGAVIGAGQ